MIATEAKISGIDDIRKEYYDYLSTIYGEISSYLKITDGMVNSEKLELMFEKTASPFVYWREARERERKPEPGQSKTASAVAPVSGHTPTRRQDAASVAGALNRTNSIPILPMRILRYIIWRIREGEELSYRKSRRLTENESYRIQETKRGKKGQGMDES